MENQHTFKSSNHIVFSCKYHVVWTPKYRRKVLLRGVEVRLREIVHEVADELQCEILTLEIMPNQVHMRCEVPPQLGIHRFVKRVKARSSRLLRQEFGWLTSRLPTLWSNSYFVTTVGDVPSERIEQFIEDQKYV